MLWRANFKFLIATNSISICGNNTATINATGCNEVITWYNSSNTIIGTGSSIEVGAGTYYAICNNVSSQMITITNIGACNTTYIATRTENFTKNNCATGCTPSTVSFTKTYTSLISQLDANSKASGDIFFNSDGQLYANNIGTCTNCNTGCIPNGLYTCSNTNDNISFINSCGNTENVFTKGSVSFICDITDNLLDVTINVLEVNSQTYSGYNISYRITKINNVVQSNVLQLQNTFTNLLPNTSYEFEIVIGKGGSLCNLFVPFTTGDCVSGCTAPAPVISISANKTTVCNPDNLVTFTATSNQCDTIEWYKEGFVGGSTLLGTGSIISLNITEFSVIKARCINCLGSEFSNSISIENTGDCTQITYTSTQEVIQCQNYTPECAPSCTPVPASVQYCTPPYVRTSTSTVSQQEADSTALNLAVFAATQDLNANGQLFANTNSTCECDETCILPSFNLSSQLIDENTIWLVGDNVLNGTHAAVCIGTTFNCGTDNGFNIASGISGGAFLDIRTLGSTQTQSYVVRVFNITSTCYTDQLITVTNTITPTCPDFTVTEATGLCNNNNTLNVTLTVTSDNSPYTYSLDGGSFIGCLSGDPCDTFEAINLTAGNHTLIIKDSLGCEHTHIFTVTTCNQL